MTRKHRRRLRHLRKTSLATVALAMMFGGCADGEIDASDELGMERPIDDVRSELVLVDSSRRLPSGDGGPVYFDPQGEFTVQVGVFRRTEEAGELVSELKTNGYPAYALSIGKKPGMRVRIGYFSTRSDAERFGAIFSEDRGLEFWVDLRSLEKKP